MLKDMFKGPTGGYDTARILFGVGGVSVIFSPLGFEAWNMARGQPFDVAAFCLGYGGLLGGYILGGGFGIAAKDKGVASAINTTAPSPPEGGQP